MKVVAGKPPPRVSSCYENLAGVCLRPKVLGSTIYIEDASKELHEGYYRFFAENVVGTVSELVYLHVKERQVVSTDPCAPFG